MKRITAIALLLVLCVSLFAGCQPDTTGVENAKKYVDGMYKNDPVETASDYTLVGIVVLEGVTYTVDWTCDKAEIIVTRNDKMVTIDVPAAGEQELPYVLTATISDEKGAKATTTFSRKVPAGAGADMEKIVEEAYKLEDGQVLCSKKGVQEDDFWCFWFRYDPYKRIPKKAKALDFSKYEEEDYSL